jgi:hypothetical protein
MPFPISGIQLCDPQPESILMRSRGTPREFARLWRSLTVHLRAETRTFSYHLLPPRGDTSSSLTETVIHIERRFPSRSIGTEERRKREGFFPDVPLADCELEREGRRSSLAHVQVVAGGISNIYQRWGRAD